MVETGDIWRRLSFVAVTAFVHQLASRMSQVGGEGAQLAAQTRQQWRQEEARARQDRESAWMATLIGGDIIRSGRFLST